MSLPRITGFQDKDLTTLNEALRGLDKDKIKTIMWFIAGDPLTTGTDKSAYIVLDFNCLILAAYARAKTAPTGADFIIDINKNGSTIWATQGNRLKIVAGTSTGSQTLFDTKKLSTGDYLTVDVDQIGSSVGGSNVTIQLKVQEL
jgi:hypothetical protein